jgi:hypothetical protein
MVAGDLRTKCSDGEARTFASRHPIRRHLRRERPARPQPSARISNGKILGPGEAPGFTELPWIFCQRQMNILYCA